MEERVEQPESSLMGNQRRLIDAAGQYLRAEIDRDEYETIMRTYMPNIGAAIEALTTLQGADEEGRDHEERNTETVQ